MKVLSTKPYSVENVKGKKYFLHTMEVELRGGRKQRIYFFNQKENDPKAGPAIELPPNKEAKENPHTGFLTLKNK